MPPEAIQLGLFILEEAIKNEPAIAAEIRELLKKNDPTPEDWAALRARVASKTYRDYVPATALPPEPAAPPAAAPEPAVVDAAPIPAPAAAPVWTGQTTDPHA